MQRFRRMFLPGLTSVTLVAAALVVSSSDQAPAQSVFHDYASEAAGNPWDYNDAADAIVGDGPNYGVRNARIEGGQFSFDVAGPAYVSPLWGGYPGSWQSEQDGGTRPIDTSRYSRLAFKLTSSGAVDAGVRWYTCADGGPADSCQGGFPFDVKPGTHVYDFALVANPSDPALARPWSGKATGLRLAFNGSASLSIDWMSVYSGPTPGADGPSGPAPVIVDPDREGGASVAPLLRGKEWDMSAPGDISRSFNVNGGVSGGSFQGTNAGPTMNDPTVVMNLGCRTFRADQFHRFTVEYDYDGVFNVEDKAGGGTNARVIWRVAGTPLTTNGVDLQNSDDLVIYPNQKRYTFDLLTNPVTAIVDPDQAGPKLGWTGEIEHVRFDPNEDRGARHWKIKSVKIAADDMAAPGTAFNIRWRDSQFAPGGVADIAIATDPSGAGAVPVATGVAVQAGENVTPWTAEGTGKRWVVLTIRRGGAESTVVSTGPVSIGTLAPTIGVNQRGSDGVLAAGDRCIGATGVGAPVAQPLTVTGKGRKPTVKPLTPTTKKKS